MRSKVRGKALLPLGQRRGRGLGDLISIEQLQALPQYQRSSLQKLIDTIAPSIGAVGRISAPILLSLLPILSKFVIDKFAKKEGNGFMRDMDGMDGMIDIMDLERLKPESMKKLNMILGKGLISI